jgi:1-deoxy-D-xylulose-5-phosphate reductoisomerase
MQQIAVLGSTGSIGCQTLDIARLFPDRVSVFALTAHSNYELFLEQVLEFGPEYAVFGDETRRPELEAAFAQLRTSVSFGSSALEDVVSAPEIDTVVTAIVGAAGLGPTVAAIRSGKKIALANKETMVIAGELISELSRHSGASIVPVDSEHSALYQCLAGERIENVERLHLTASGGPFRTRPVDSFHSITRAEALRHPNWEMGAKITIDSATMMNKGLEVIEARWLFGIEPDRIDVLIHPQSIVHSMVTFVDGSTKAQMGTPNMRIPIQYALSSPDRWSAPHTRVDWPGTDDLEFFEPDGVRFPSLDLAYNALESGGVAPAALNAANEQAVTLFLNDEIGFSDITRLVADVLRDVDSILLPTLQDIAETDLWARIRTKELTMAQGH